MKPLFIILFIALSFTAKSQIFFNDICGFKADTCGVSWGVEGAYKLKGTLPDNFETNWNLYSCKVLKEPEYVNGNLIKFGELELIKK